MSGFRSVVIALGAVFLASCAVQAPSFDLPTDETGAQETSSITQRIRCELASLVDPILTANSIDIDYLTKADYYFSGLIYLDTTDKGNISPRVTFPDTMKYVFGINADASQQRQDTLSIWVNERLSRLAQDVGNQPRTAKCPDFDGNLSGDLGLARSVKIALATAGLRESTNQDPTSGEFSGSVEFQTRLAITGAGPTWTFRHFTGPGELGGVSRMHTNRLTFGFAAGKGKNPYYNAAQRARILVEQQLQAEAVVQLSGIRGAVR
jgi:hypothetical protein